MSQGRVALVVATVATTVATFATGGMLSARKDASVAWVAWSHRVGGFLAAALAAYSVSALGR